MGSTLDDITMIYCLSGNEEISLRNDVWLDKIVSGK